MRLRTACVVGSDTDCWMWVRACRGQGGLHEAGPGMIREYVCEGAYLTWPGRWQGSMTDGDRRLVGVRPNVFSRHSQHGCGAGFNMAL